MHLCTSIDTYGFGKKPGQEGSKTSYVYFSQDEESDADYMTGHGSHKFAMEDRLLDILGAAGVIRRIFSPSQQDGEEDVALKDVSGVSSIRSCMRECT